MEFTIINTIAIIISIFSCILAVKSIIICKNIKYKLEESYKEEKVDNEYIYSIEFNRLLDGLIQQLLHTHSNEDIVNKILLKLYTYDKTKNIDKNILREYVTEVLKEYINKYQDPLIKNYTIDEISDEEITKPIINNKINNTTTINLNDFYK